MLRLAFSHGGVWDRYFKGTTDGHRAFAKHTGMMPSFRNGANVGSSVLRGFERTILIDTVWIRTCTVFIISHPPVSVNQKLRAVAGRAQGAEKI